MQHPQVVPQLLYSVARHYDRLPAIMFEENGLAGVSLDHALRNELHGLRDAHSTPTMTNVRKVTLRLNWPGYLPWSDVLHVCDHTSEARPISLERLAHLVACKIRNCLDDLNTESNRVHAQNPTWLVDDIRVEDIVLLSLQHVARGSWQPVLMYLPRENVTTVPYIITENTYMQYTY